MTDWRSQKRQARVTLVEVYNAINHLKLQGIHNPSLRAIHGVIGRGSLDKISAFKKQLDDDSSLLKDNTKGNQDNLKDVLKDILKDAITDNIKDVYSRLDDIEGQLSLNLDGDSDDNDNADLEPNKALGELRQMWLDAVDQYQLSQEWPNVKEADEAIYDLHQLWLDAVEQSSWFQEKLYETRELWLNAVDLWIASDGVIKLLRTENTDLKSKLEAVQNEAQVAIDELNQKLTESRHEIARQAKEYSDLHNKHTDLKASMDKDKMDTTDGDGSASVPQSKSTQRDPVVLESKANRVKVEIIIDTDKAKARVVELAKQGLNASEIAQRISDEGYRTKGRFDGKVKAYAHNNINKWWIKWKKNGSL